MRLLFFSCLLVCAAACSPGSDPGEAIFISGRTMGTTYTVQVPSMSLAEQTDVHAEIESALDDINLSMSTYQTDSAITRFNRNRSTDWQIVPADLAAVAKAAQMLSQKSGGAFDATVSPLVGLWGFGGSAEADESVPSAEEVSDVLQATGYYRLQARLSPPALMKQIPDLEIDLSAIAKGYAVDTIAGLLKNRSYQNYLVEIGGELRVSGNNAAGEPWTIGVESPAESSPTQKLTLVSGAVATSGDYRNFRVKSGQRYSHIIDPRNGYPVSHNLASVTVIHNNAMLADGWSTALMVLGPEDGLTLANTNELAAFFIERTFAGYVTHRSQSFISLVDTAGD